MALWQDREYFSQYSTNQVGILLVQNGIPIDADADSVNVLMFAEATGAQVFTRAATRLSVGDYVTNFNSAETSVPGEYTLVWTYLLGGQNQYVESGIVVGPAAPAYDGLPIEMQDIVQNVWMRMADCIDSPGGGPNLLTYNQSKFGLGRVGQLLRVAMGRLNTVAQPYQTFTVDGIGGAEFPYQQWGSLLESVCWVETLKHLMRSYTEQPEFVGGGNVSRLDRRDYMTRWGAIMKDEEALVRSQLDVFKISQMGLGKPAVLISGGVYGRYGPTRMAGSVAARPRYWTRFY